MKAWDMAVVPQTRETLMALGAKRGPIVVGPWLSEIGFELLYWIPFLRWAVAFAGLHPEDLWVVSRGGCRSWYADIGSNYVDVLDFYSPQAFRAGNAQRMQEQASHARTLHMRIGHTSTKQIISTKFDRQILAHVTKATGLSGARVLHPSLMYCVFRPFWRRKAPELYAQMTTPRRLTAPEKPDGLPASYVAAKFYASMACRDSPDHRRMVNDIVRTMAASTDVVLLHGGARFDDHGEFPIDTHPRVHRLPMDPATNLETQTAAIAHASAYVGTYGGFAYLASFLGVPTRTFYATPNFRKDHRQVLDQVCRTSLHVPFSVELLAGGSGRLVHRAA